MDLSFLLHSITCPSFPSPWSASPPVSQSYFLHLFFFSSSSSSSLIAVELWYSRTTLILGVVFVFAYIMSWGWMTYVMEETARNSVSAFQHTHHITINKHTYKCTCIDFLLGYGYKLKDNKAEWTPWLLHKIIISSWEILSTALTLLLLVSHRLISLSLSSDSLELE